MPTKNPTNLSRPDYRAEVRDVLLAGIDWSDTEAKLQGHERIEYAQSARLIIESPVWKNEIRRLYELWMSSAVSQAQSYEELLNMRNCITAIRILDERLNHIASWIPKPEPNHDAFEPL